MPEITEVRACRAPARQVWKLLFDPARFSQWWPGWERVEPDGSALNRYDARWPDFAYPTAVSTDPARGQVVISCLLSDIVHRWTLAPDGSGCQVSVFIAIPDAESARADELAATAREALAALVALAES